MFSYPRLSLVNRSCGSAYFLFWDLPDFCVAGFAPARADFVFAVVFGDGLAAGVFFAAGFAAFFISAGVDR